MKPPLWLTSTASGRVVKLATCRNCGRVKVTSRPCSLDHLAAIMEFNAARKAGPA